MSPRPAPTYSGRFFWMPSLTVLPEIFSFTSLSWAWARLGTMVTAAHTTTESRIGTRGFMGFLHRGDWTPTWVPSALHCTTEGASDPCYSSNCHAREIPSGGQQIFNIRNWQPRVPVRALHRCAWGPE